MAYIPTYEREAREEGIKKGKLDSAREFLKNGVAIDVVIKSTGFPREEIEKLAATVH